MFRLAFIWRWRVKFFYCNQLIYFIRDLNSWLFKYIWHIFASLIKLLFTIPLKVCFDIDEIKNDEDDNEIPLVNRTFSLQSINIQGISKKFLLKSQKFQNFDANSRTLLEIPDIYRKFQNFDANSRLLFRLIKKPSYKRQKNSK